MDQPGKVANPARGQLNRENDCSLSPFARDFDLARRIRPFRPASACSFPTLRLNLVLTHGIPPVFRGGVHLFILPRYVIGSVPSLSGYAITYRWRSLPRVRRPGPVVLKVVPVTDAAFSGHHGPINVCLSFSTPTIIGIKWACLIRYTPRTVSYAKELASVSICYSRGNGFNTPLSRLLRP